MKEKLEVIMQSLQKVGVRCQCYQWMGGCKGEYQCSLGHLRDAVSKLHGVIEKL